MALHVRDAIARWSREAIESRRPFLTLWLIVLILHFWVPLMLSALALAIPRAAPMLERLLLALFWPGLLWGYNWEEIMIVVGLVLSVTGWTIGLLPLWLWYRSRRRLHPA